MGGGGIIFFPARLGPVYKERELQNIDGTLIPREVMTRFVAVVIQFFISKRVTLSTC